MMSTRAGGLTPAFLPTKEVEAITVLIRPLYERESGKKPSVFQPVMHRTQVVAGLNYFIKVLVDKETSKCVHLKVYKELDPNKFVMSLTSFIEEKALDSPIEP